MEKQIIELPKQFIGAGEVKGFEFSQMSKSELAYMYKVRQNDKIYFEVFKRLNSPVCIDFEKRIYSETEFKESYPKSRQFGATAWSYFEMEDAVRKFGELSQSKNK